MFKAFPQRCVTVAEVCPRWQVSPDSDKNTVPEKADHIY